MLNWEILTVRNIVVVALLACIGLYLFNHFQTKDSN